jgi:hypothetical protein
MSYGPPVRGVLHTLEADLGRDPWLEAATRYVVAELEDLLMAHQRFEEYLRERDESPPRQ